MSLQARQRVDSDGATIIEFTESEGYFDHERVRLRVPMDGRMSLTIEDDNEPIYKASFERRQLTFPPVSVIGRGEATELTGVSVTDEGKSVIDETYAEGDRDIPFEATVALNAFGFSPVPQGEWWL